MSVTYSYPRPMVTVDMFLLRFYQGRLETVLVRRKNDPFRDKWAFPGGFVEMEETLEQGAIRELEEETGIKNVSLFQLYAAGDPDRDPRGRTITVIYGGIIAPPFFDVRGASDAAKARWFPISGLPSLAFDHEYLLNRIMSEFKQKCFWELKLFLFLKEEFGREDLDQLSNSMLGMPEAAGILLRAGVEAGLVKVLSRDRYAAPPDSRETLTLPSELTIPLWMHLLSKK